MSTVRKNKELLRELEMENLPIMILEEMVEFSVLAEGYPIVAETAINIDVDSGYREEDFTMGRYSYQYRGENPYFVIACRFPFEETDEYIDFAKTVYVLLSKNLKKLHVFVEILKKKEEQDINLHPYFYNIIELKIEKEEMRVYSLGQRMNSEEEQTGAFCVAWAYAQEQDEKRSQKAKVK